MTLARGTRLGPYEILEPVGRGGMGEVYRARDTRLAREVAVKLLPEASAGDPERRARFDREARSVAQLNHPNVLTLFDVGEHEGSLYLVTELLAGETLERRLARGPVLWTLAVRWADQIASGLAAAHERGIVHRDLKPGNLWITADERVKILDFGIAKVLAVDAGPDEATLARDGSNLTTEGSIVGTVGYMSPEQVRGEPVSGAADLFSLGAVLYQMLSGERPFRGRSQMDVLSGVLHGEPPPLALPSGAPPGLGGVVARCLEKEPEQRFSTARDLVFALRALTSSAAAAQGLTTPPPPSLAVLPFEELGGGTENTHLAIGLADAVITELARSDSLVVRPTAASLRHRNVADPLAAGREMQVGAVLAGAFQRAGDRLRITFQLVDVASARSLWGEKVDASISDVFALQDEVAARVAEALRVRLGVQLPSAAAPPATGAYEAYLRGRYHLYRESVASVREGIESFERARQLDPAFPQAWVGLADAFLRMAFTFEPEGDWYERAETMCRRALELDPELPEAHYACGRLAWTPRSGFDVPEALRELCRATAGRPGLGEAHLWLGTVLQHVSLFDEAVEALERALAIDPDNMLALEMVALTRYYQGRFAEGRSLTQRAAGRGEAAWRRYQLALCDIQTGDLETAAGRARTGQREFPYSVLMLSVDGLLAALEGDAAAAHAAVGRVEARRQAFGHYHHAQYDIACILALLGEPARALEYLAAAAANGFPCGDFFAIDPLLAGLRGMPGFTALLAKLEREKARYRASYAEARPRS